MSKDGGPAFPHVYDVWEDNKTRTIHVYPGMSLRDYFAGQALAGIMANPERWKQIAEDYKSGKKTYDQCSAANANKAYSIADAMIAQRSVVAPIIEKQDQQLPS
jgi:hypothetical protein